MLAASFSALNYGNAALLRELLAHFGNYSAK
jgi:hypothetical protein